MMRSQKSEVRSRNKKARSALLSLLIFAFCLLPFAFASDDWRQAMPGYEFNFARDHASHPDYKIEWWYYTGNLAAKDGHRFGYQLTFFRVGVDPQPVNPSRWAVRDLFMAHLAVSDLKHQKFHFTEKINRAGIGWAGAATDVYRVWNEDWEVKNDAQGRTLMKAVQDGRQDGIGLEFALDPGKAPVIHGARGISRKGSQPGNASHYYSQTRMPTRGAITLDGQRYEVEGLSWMDHEFGTSFLESQHLGWDWFSVQLDDGSELMLYRFRRSDGQRDPNTSGTIIDPSGKASTITVNDFTLEPNAQWRSPATGAKYPVAWKINLPSRNLDLLVWAAMDNQELVTSESTRVNYWEGAIEVKGTKEGRPIQGRGYLEMTGYAGAAMSAILESIVATV